MAEVWRALDQRLERPVAIKFLTSRYAEDPEFLVRFFSEAQAVAGISHAHVVRVLDFGSADAGPYLVLELVEGGSLCDRVGAEVGIAEATRLVREAAEGAGAAHERGIVHRDLKPGNILLTETGTAKLADFGIATLGSVDHLAATGTAIGSPNYISPEGARGAGVSPASDVYSLGIVLYELLTGRRPFESGSATAVALAHVDQIPEAPSVHEPSLPGWIDELVLRCLAKDPSERYADGYELAAALRAGEAGAPIAPASEEPLDESRSPRLLVASVASALALGLGGFLIASPSSPIAPSAEADTGSSLPIDPERGATPTESATPYEIDAATVSSTDPTPSPSSTSGPGERKNVRSGVTSDDAGDPATEDEPEPDETVPSEEEPEPEPTPEETTPTEEETPVEEEPTTSPEEAPAEDPAQQDVTAQQEAG